MERRTGSLVSQGSAEKSAGEDIAALLDRFSFNSSDFVILSIPKTTIDPD